MADTPKKEDVLSQFRKEKTSAMKARQVRINNWSQNEQLYNGQPTATFLTRSNLHIPKVFESVQTMSSKMGNLPEVEFEVKPEGDENSADIMKANWEYDAARSNLSKLWQFSKTEAGIYGQAIFKVIPGNDGNKIALIDTMAFLINPTAKVCRDALYCGEQFIYKTLDQIEKDAEKFEYDKEEIQKLKEKKVDTETAPSNSQEKSIRDLRLAYLGYANVGDLGAKMVELTEWYTMIDGDPYCLTIANDSYVLRIVRSKELGLPRHNPYVSYATYPRGVAFWTPSVADVERDPNLAMDVAINQLIDNNTYRNFGMVFVSSTSGLKQSSIVPRPLGIITVNTGADGKIGDQVLPYTPPEINQAAQTISILSGIADASVGLTGSPMGSQGQKKQSATAQAAQAAMAEMKTNLIKQNAVECVEELGQLYADTLKMNLTKPRDVKVYGFKPITLTNVTKANFKDVEFIAHAQAPETSQDNKAIKQKAKIELYQLFKDDPKIPGQTFLRKNVAKEFNLDPEDIDKLFTADDTQGVPQPPAAAPAAPAAAPAPAAPAPASAIPAQNPSPMPAQAQSVVPPAIR